MEKLKAVFKNAWPYQGDKMNLPVADVESALPFYQRIMGFRLVSKKYEPVSSAILERDGMQIALAENGGDPTQDGCFFEVDNLETAFAEMKSNGLEKESADLSTQKHGETTWKVFFIIAPDGLCYCIGERQA